MNRHLGVTAFLALSSIALPGAAAEQSSDEAQALAAVGSFLIISQLNSSVCLTVSNGNSGNGASIIMQGCDSANQSQWWTWDNGRLRSALGRCLDLQFGNSGNGAAIQLFDCGNQVAQQWFENGSELRSRIGTGSMCLDIRDNNTGWGAAVTTFGCGG